MLMSLSLLSPEVAIYRCIFLPFFDDLFESDHLSVDCVFVLWLYREWWSYLIMTSVVSSYWFALQIETISNTRFFI